MKAWIPAYNATIAGARPEDQACAAAGPEIGHLPDGATRVRGIDLVRP